MEILLFPLNLNIQFTLQFRRVEILLAFNSRTGEKKKKKIIETKA